jgi:hypothetical protein
MKTVCCNTRHAQRVEKRTICMNPKCENYLGDTKLNFEFGKLRNSVAFSLFFFSALFTFDDFSKAHPENVQSLLMSRKVEKVVPLTVENLQKELISQEVICPNEVLAQIKIESAHLKSYLTRKANNMLGMRYPFRRPSTACGIYLPEQDTVIMGTKEELSKYRKIQNNYAVFATWQDAVADYKLWQENCFKVNEKYLEFLGKNYAEDSLYVKKIRQMAYAK